MPVFALEFSILPIAASAIGGIGTLAGPLLGAFILVPLFRDPERIRHIAHRLLRPHSRHMCRCPAGRDIPLPFTKV